MSYSDPIVEKIIFRLSGTLGNGIFSSTLCSEVQYTKDDS